LLYNHYVVRRKLPAPHISKAVKLIRPEGTGGDHFGFGTLTFTLDAKSCPFPGPLPASPTGLVVQPGMGRVDLKWDIPALRDASGYTVRRARADGGDYQTIAEWDKNTSNQYTDTTAEPGVEYRYVVAARNPAGTGPKSAPVMAKAEAPGPLPPGWTISFIGKSTNFPTDQIKATYSEKGNRSMGIIGVGARDLVTPVENLTFAWRKVQGDFVLTGRLIVSPAKNYKQSADPKMGLMIRESLEPGARFASVSLGEVGLRGTRARFRAETNGGTTEMRGNDYCSMPMWYRLERKGSTITAWHSPDGSDWFKVGSASVQVPGDSFVGFFVAGSGGTKSGTVEVIFDNTSLMSLDHPSGTITAETTESRDGKALMTDKAPSAQKPEN
jgi:regulation of enolase protein 1 (concanavalin A-like superfamily)